MLVLFDMDGLLLDTEPLWAVAMQNICDKYKLPLHSGIFKYTTGLRIDEVTAFWKEHLDWPSHLNSYDLAMEIVDEIIYLAKHKGKVMPGVLSLLETLKKKNTQTAVVTSSPNRMMEDLLNHFDLTEYFDAFFSAESVAYGKPHPAIYLEALTHFNSSPFQTIALEDSVNGMISARAAKINTIVIPDIKKYEDPVFHLANKKAKSMEEIHYELLEKLILPEVFVFKK